MQLSNSTGYFHLYMLDICYAGFYLVILTWKLYFFHYQINNMFYVLNNKRNLSMVNHIYNSLSFQSSQAPDGKNLLMMNGKAFSVNSFSAISRQLIVFICQQLNSAQIAECLPIWLALIPRMVAFSYLVRIGSVIFSSLGYSI